MIGFLSTPRRSHPLPEGPAPGVGAVREAGSSGAKFEGLLRSQAPPRPAHKAEPPARPRPGPGDLAGPRDVQRPRGTRRAGRGGERAAPRGSHVRGGAGRVRGS